MKRLATISCRLGGQDCHCAFSFSRSLTAVGHDYFKDPRSLLATREGEVCMKDKDHHMRHPRGHLRDRASAQRTPGCAWRDDQFGCGQNTVLGWSDPTFAHDCVAKVNRGSLQPNKQLRAVRARREFRRSRCRRQELPTATSSSPPSSRWNVRKSRESEEINDTRMRRVTQKKTPDWAGATPLFGSQSAQKFCPGRSRPLLHSGAHVFSPRAKQPRSWPS